MLWYTAYSRNEGITTGITGTEVRYGETKGGSVPSGRRTEGPAGGTAVRHGRPKGKRGGGRSWYDWLWVASALYPALGFFNILFAWLGLLCFLIPLIIALVGGGKTYCNRYCGRGQLFGLLGGRLGLSRRRDMPRFLKSKWFRYGFLIFFLAMFANMLVVTGLVFAGMREPGYSVKLFWTFRVPWHWAYHGTLFSPGVAQFAYGFYGLMLTSTLLGLILMVLFKPCSWCVCCPMGTMTQLVCRARNVTGSRMKRAGSDILNTKTGSAVTPAPDAEEPAARPTMPDRRQTPID